MLTRTSLRIPIRVLTGWLLAFTALPLAAQAQPQAPVRHQLSLQQAVDYALQNNETVRNAELAERSAWSRKNETRAQGLPQLDANINGNYNYKIQAQAIDFNGTPTIVRFGLPYNSGGNVQFSQLVFDGRYITALRASKAFLELSRVQTFRTETEVATGVSKAYYNALVSQRRLELLQSNLVRSEALLRETRVQVENGLAELIDVNRLQVSLNSLRSDIENAQAAVDISRLLLKFQMGMPLTDVLVQTDTIALDANNLGQVAEMLKDTASFNADNRVELRELLANRRFLEFNVKQYQAGYLPDLRLNANYGWTTFGNTLGILYGPGNTFGYGAVGLSLNIPIFDGFLKRSQIEQARYQNQQLDNNIRQARQNYTLEFRQAQVNVRNALARTRNQQENIALAEEVYRQTQVKYSQGIGSNLEVTVAEGELRDAQINYINALLDAYLAQVDLQVATGTLLKK